MFDPLGEHGEIFVSSSDPHAGYFVSAAAHRGNEDLVRAMQESEASFFENMGQIDPFLIDDFDRIETIYSDPAEKPVVTLREDVQAGFGYRGQADYLTVMPPRLRGALIALAKLRAVEQTNRSIDALYVIPEEVALKHYMRFKPVLKAA